MRHLELDEPHQREETTVKILRHRLGLRSAPSRYRASVPRSTATIDDGEPYTQFRPDLVQRIESQMGPQEVDPIHPQWAEVDEHGAPEPVVDSWSREETYRAPSTLEVDTDKQRDNEIVQHWNNASWVQAEVCIKEVLDCKATHHLLRRRLHFLLGVLSSLTGDWVQALDSFICVLNRPIDESTPLDSGDCAAAYCLGDTYLLLGRRSEALLAYALAEQSSLFHGSERNRAHQHIRAEQAACQSGSNRAAVKLEMDRKMQKKEALCLRLTFRYDNIDVGRRQKPVEYTVLAT